MRYFLIIKYKVTVLQEVQRSGVPSIGITADLKKSRFSNESAFLRCVPCMVNNLVVQVHYGGS
jgi:hypothetical protein